MLNIDIYTDGSFSKSYPSVVYGAIVALGNKEPFLAQRYIITKDYLVNMNNVGGELTAAANSVFMVAEYLNEFSPNWRDVEVQFTLYHDYEGIRNFIEGKPPWNPSKKGSAYYVAMIKDFKSKYSNVRLRFVKVRAHSGIKWNEAADSISKGSIPYYLKNVMCPDLYIRN